MQLAQVAVVAVLALAATAAASLDGTLASAPIDLPSCKTKAGAGWPPPGGGKCDCDKSQKGYIYAWSIRGQKRVKIGCAKADGDIVASCVGRIKEEFGGCESIAKKNKWNEDKYTKGKCRDAIMADKIAYTCCPVPTSLEVKVDSKSYVSCTAGEKLVQHHYGCKRKSYGGTASSKRRATAVTGRAEDPSTKTLEASGNTEWFAETADAVRTHLNNVRGWKCISAGVDAKAKFVGARGGSGATLRRIVELMLEQ